MNTPRDTILSSSPLVIAFNTDITTLRAACIVNAANVTLLGGGGVDGAIHRAAGSALREACEALPEVEPGVRCPVGEARWTPGFRLPSQNIIHTVGPMFPGARSPVYQGEITRDYDPVERLEACFRSCLTLAQEKGFLSIIFPAISCGVFGCSIPICVKVARKVIESQNWGPIKCIGFALFLESEYQSFVDTWRMLDKDDETKSLDQRLLDILPRWMPGMELIMDNRRLRIISVRGDRIDAADTDGVWHGMTSDQARACCRPNLKDAATRGCLLDLVREVYGDPTISPVHQSVGTDYPTNVKGDHFWDVWEVEDSVGDDEAEAIVAALEYRLRNR